MFSALLGSSEEAQTRAKLAFNPLWPRTQSTTSLGVPQAQPTEGGGGFVRGQFRGEIFDFQFRAEIFLRIFLRDMGHFLLLVHPLWWW